MNKNITTKKKILTALSATSLLAVMLACWSLLELISVISIDDAMYAGWTQHGFKYFIQKNVWHYKNFNGRFFVHIIMQAVLFFEEHLYAVIFPFFITVGAFLFTNIAKKEWEIHQKLFTSALALLAYLCLSPKYITPTAMWVAGGFNYIFPLIIIFSFYYLFVKNKSNTKAMTYLLPLAFLCGATTEQYGMYTVGLIVLTYLFDAIESKKLDSRSFAYLSATIAGLLTVLLAPPTIKRFTTTTADTSVKGISGIINNWTFLGGKESGILLPALFMLFIALLSCYKRTKTDENGKTVKYYPYNPLFMLGFSLSAGAALCYALNLHIISMIITYVFVIFVAISMLIKKETRELGKILVCGFGTYVMLSITSIATCWTAVPCIISFIIVLCVMFVDAVSTINVKAIGIVLASAVCICGCVLYGISYSGYKKESAFCNNIYEQLQNAKESGKIEYNFDDTIASRLIPYRNMTLVDFYPVSYYQEKFDIPDNVKYIITSNKRKVANICCNGIYSQAPAIKLNGSIFVPSQTPYLDICLDKDIKASKLYNDDETLIGVEINGDTINCSKSDTLTMGHIVYVKLDLILAKYGYKCHFDRTENTYILTK